MSSEKQTFLWCHAVRRSRTVSGNLHKTIILAYIQDGEVFYRVDQLLLIDLEVYLKTHEDFKPFEQGWELLKTYKNYTLWKKHFGFKADTFFWLSQVGIAMGGELINKIKP